MVELSRLPNAYIRPSPSSGQLGGTALGTSDGIILCEANGFDVCIVETVGVGQSEVSVVDMCDIFILLVAPAGM
jgi:LAO/AO transport system kinase